VLIADVDGVAAATTASELGALHADVDVTNLESVAALADRAISDLTRVDILVNAAGILTVSTALEMAVEDWDRVMAVNARGTFLCCQAFGRHMVKAGGGCIVNMASIAGKKGDPSLSHYSASKFAVIGFTQSLAAELAEFNVRVNSVCPGAVDTPMMRDLAKAWGSTVELVASRYQLIKRPQEPREIGHAVVFLATAPSITGQAINVDGGSVFH
jgi:meso-butanediol dehydrogenase/(S,S)-butanediol dehydrogenase/diacetyl reductase